MCRKNWATFYDRVTSDTFFLVYFYLFLFFLGFFRPVSYTHLALIPLAFRGDLPGNEIPSPMAKVILGGLLTSTFLNAFIIPIVYELMNRKKK